MDSGPRECAPTTPWWVNLAWRLYAPAPAGLDPMLQTLGGVVRPLGDLRVRIFRQRGPVHPDGHVGSLVVAGRGALANPVSARFFMQPPRTEMVGVVPLWRLPAALARLGASADATVAVLDRRVAPALFGADHLLVPGGVSQVLRVPTPSAIMTMVDRPVQRWLRRALPQLTAEVSHAAADFDAFYRTMYVPFARRRFGPDSIVLNVHKLRRAFRRGGVVWARCEGQRVAGCLFLVRGDVIRALVLGTAAGDPGVEATGALYGLYFFALEYAARRRLVWMDLGHGAPVLSEGVLRHKSWWGARLVDDGAIPSYLAVRWAEPNVRLRNFLARHPLIFRHGDGLAAVTALDDDGMLSPGSVDRLCRSVALPGLRRLVAIAPEGQESEYIGRSRTPASRDDPCDLVVCGGADVWAACADARR